MEQPILSAAGLVKSYGRRRVVDGVELDVYPGEIVGLLGPNGAGKTTTFRMICGQVKPDTAWDICRRSPAFLPN